MMRSFYWNAFASIYLLDPQVLEQKSLEFSDHTQKMGFLIRALLNAYLLLASFLIIAMPRRLAFNILSRMPLIKAAHGAMVSILLMMYYDEK